MTADEARQRAIVSLLDVVEELAQGLAHGQTPEPDWAEVVATSFAEHRAELRFPDDFDLVADERGNVDAVRRS